jgi:hypothetical protein
MKWAVEIQKTNLNIRNLTDLLQGIEFELLDGVEKVGNANSHIKIVDLHILCKHEINYLFILNRIRIKIPM